MFRIQPALRATALIMSTLIVMTGVSGPGYAAQPTSDPGSNGEPTRHELSLIPANGADPSLLGPATYGTSPEELQAEARRRMVASGQVAGFDAFAPTPTTTLRPVSSPPSVPEDDFVRDCKSNPAAGSQFGYIKNRLMWCARYIAFDAEVSNNREGFIWMPVTLIGYGRDDGVRSVRLFLKPDYVLFEGTYTLTSSFQWGVECTHSTRGCGVTGANVRLPVAQWESNALTNTWVSWDVTSDETLSTQQDQILFNVFNFDISGKNGGDKNSNEYFIRCDSADYFSARPKACVFNDVIPHLQYRLRNPDGTDSNGREVTEHIQQAFTDPDSTYPQFPDRHKDIPGDYTRANDANYLERIPSDSAEYAANRLEKDRACQRRAPYRDTGLPDPPISGVQECDEFPFASTMQGAGARGRGLPFDFSVKAVTAGDNSSAGNALMVFYRDDRILYSLNQPRQEWIDLFYVEILPGGEGDGFPGENAPIRDYPPEVNAGPDMFGDEGGAVTLHGSAYDFFDQPAVTWSYSLGSDIDPGTTCAFTDPHATTTGITCTDDGTVEVRLTATDNRHDPVSDAAAVYVSNVDPSVAVVSPTPWQLFRAGTSVTLGSPVNDPGANDTHTCVVNWDDGSIQSYQAVGGNCAATHTFAHAGMYTIGVSTTDDDGGSDAESVLAVVYDPNAGWVNLDGATLTPSGALVSAPNAPQWTWEHLAAHYYSASGPPVGTAKTWVPQTPYRMESTALQWLVVTPDGKIAVRGTGTGEDGSALGFVFYGYRGCPRTGPDCQAGVDRTRMVVWRLSAGAHPGAGTVYDNQATAGYDLDVVAPLPLTSGAVQIHH